MDLEKRINKKAAIFVILGILILLLIIGTTIGKLFFWDRFDSRSTKEKELAGYITEVLLHPENLTARINLGWTYYKLGRIGEAEKEYREALRIDPRSVGANYNLASILLEQGKNEEAKAKFQKVLELDKNHTLAYFGLGETLRLLKDYKEAEEALLQALLIEPNAGDILCQLAMVYEDWGKKEEAINYFKRVADLLPNNQEAKSGLERLGQSNHQPASPKHNGGN